MKRQRGVALITVLLVVAIVTVVCAGMIARQQLSIRGTANQVQARQAWHYALGGEALAQSILRRDLRASGNGSGQPAVDHLLEPWALPQPAYDLDEGQGQVQIRIEDLAGRFNLNSLVRQQQPNAAALAQFRRLLLRLQINEPYAERLLDWLGWRGLFELHAAATAGVAMLFSFLVPEPESATSQAATLIGQGQVLASPVAMATVRGSVVRGETVLPARSAATYVWGPPAV